MTRSSGHSWELIPFGHPCPDAVLSSMVKRLMEADIGGLRGVQSYNYVIYMYIYINISNCGQITIILRAFGVRFRITSDEVVIIRPDPHENGCIKHDESHDIQSTKWQYTWGCSMYLSECWSFFHFTYKFYFGPFWETIPPIQTIYK